MTKRRGYVIAFDGTRYYRSLFIEQTQRGDIYFGQIFKRKWGGHFSLHADGKFSFKGDHGRLWPPIERRIPSCITGVESLVTFTALENTSLIGKPCHLNELKDPYVIVNLDEIAAINTPNYFLFVLEPGKEKLLQTLGFFTNIMAGQHLLHIFRQFQPWVVLLVGSVTTESGIRVQ